jgi:hypothetical protein
MARPTESPAPSTGEARFHLRTSAKDAGSGLRPGSFHPEWLANPVIVPKANSKLRMCVDYTDLKKAYTKDPFLLPRIDQVIDSMMGVTSFVF